MQFQPGLSMAEFMERYGSDDKCEAALIEVEIDDAYLGGERSGGKVGRGSENKVPFVAAVQTTPEGQPQFVCLRQQPFTHEEVATFAARSIAPSATVISDGLWCFGAVQMVGADHGRV